MHSKSHFKFQFKSSKISTVSVKIIFFLNTSLPKEHYQIYFTIFEATKLEIQILQNSTKSGINEQGSDAASSRAATARRRRASPAKEPRLP